VVVVVVVAVVDTVQYMYHGQECWVLGEKCELDVVGFGFWIPCVSKNVRIFLGLNNS
jgi:hypothetical protein